LTGEKGKARRLPSRDECIELLREHGCGEDVIAHSLAVASLAVRFARKCEADVDLVEAGALLHDLGRCKSHGIDHAVRGAEVAKELKLPDQIVRIVERHIGGGIDRAEAKKLGLPVKDYTPETLEEKIVSHADNLIAGTKRTTVKEAVGWLVRQGLPDAAMKVLKLHEDLSAKCGMNLDDI
jgi:tRNA (cytidine56-2'-O)-methyltransferase